MHEIISLKADSYAQVLPTESNYYYYIHEKLSVESNYYEHEILLL